MWYCMLCSGFSLSKLSITHDYEWRLSMDRGCSWAKNIVMLVSCHVALLQSYCFSGLGFPIAFFNWTPTEPVNCALLKALQWPLSLVYRLVGLPNSKWRPSGDLKWNEKIHPRERSCVTHRCASEIVLFRQGVTNAHVFWLAHVGRGDPIGQELVSLRARHARLFACALWVIGSTRD